MNYAARLLKLRKTFKKNNCDALAISQLTNVRYLCGYTGSAGLILLTADTAMFITDFRYRAQAAHEVIPLFETVIAERGLWPQAAQLVKSLGVREVGFEAEHISVAVHQQVTGLLKPARPIATQGVIEGLRLRKDADEIAVIRRAAKIIDECFDEFCAFVRPGMREIDVADEITRQMRLRGASGPSFDTIVASGARGALPHGVASQKKIALGEMITLDMGAVLEGYCSDFTRTVCVGKPTREQQKVYELVWQAQAEASAALTPGLGCKAADSIARDIITAGGYGAAFGHGLGHGVGMDIHEQPRLSQLGKGKLQVGMVVTCEPGIYLEEWGGVRIEDLILITADGCENLSRGRNPRKLIAL